MPVRTSIPCRSCGGKIVIFLVERTLVARCSACKECRPARDEKSPSHPRLENVK